VIETKDLENLEIEKDACEKKLHTLESERKALIVADKNTEQAEKDVKKISTEIAETDKKIKSKHTELERINRNIIDKKMDIKKAKVTTTNSNSKLVIETKDLENLEIEKDACEEKRHTLESERKRQKIQKQANDISYESKKKSQ